MDLAHASAVLDTNTILDLWVFDDVRLGPLRRAIEEGRLALVSREDCVEELRLVLAYPSLAVPEARRVRDQPGFRFTRHRPGVLAQPLPRSMPVLRIEDVVLDLAGRGSDGYAIGLVTRACQRQLTTAARLLERVRGRARHPRRALLIGLLEDAAGGTTSFLEHGYLTRVERPHGLPPAARQHVVPETGHRSDGAYVVERVLLEHDGRAFHVEDAREADLARDATHLAHGWVTVRTTYPMVFAEACATARRVEDV